MSEQHHPRCIYTVSGPHPERCSDGFVVEYAGWPKIDPAAPFPVTRETVSGNRQFDTGATRDTEEGKLDFEGFLSHRVLHRYAEYMHEHRLQKDGTMRASDNWQLGMPLAVYMKSMWRHFMEVWRHHRDGTMLRGMAAGHVPNEFAKKEQDALCALLFNVMGYLDRRLKGETE